MTVVKLKNRPSANKEQDLMSLLVGSASMYKKEVSPKKGQDYFTPEEIEQFKKDVTPIKGQDYFTAQEVREIINRITAQLSNDLLDRITPKKGIHYQDGKDGKDGRDIDEKKIALSVFKMIPIPKDGENGKDAISPSLESFKKEIMESFEELKGKKLGVKDVDGLENRINQIAAKVEKNYGGHGGTTRNIKTTLVTGGLYKLTSPYPVLGEMEVYVGGGRLFFESQDFVSTIIGGNRVTQINLSTSAQADIAQGSQLIIRGK